MKRHAWLTQARYILSGALLGVPIFSLVSSHFGLTGPTPEVVGAFAGAASAALWIKLAHIL